MFLLDGSAVWSASDLAAASECEFRVARSLDVRLQRVSAPPEVADPLGTRIKELGDRHESRVMSSYESDEAGLRVVSVERVTGRHTRAALLDLHARSIAAFADADLVYQAGFFDGAFLGYADFVERSPLGWVVADTKLARSAKPKAMLQVAAYADQLERSGLPVAPVGALLLGDGRREDVPLHEVMPVFRARRDRLREIIAARLAASGPLAWGDPDHLVCGTCAECAAAIATHRDVLVVAGLRRDQRLKLRDSGIETIDALAAAAPDAAPPDLSPATFARLRVQAQMQVESMATGRVSFRRTDAGAPGYVAPVLPEPSDGDIFFDFEGDPLYSEQDPARAGLEYLWGLRLATGAKGEGEFRALWAHDYASERTALADFMQLVAARRRQFPDLHIYHYAPYEVTALKRLAGTYGEFEDELDDLLRRRVFVDLYATVKQSVLVSQPSYSIKKLEPLYMGEELREGDVTQGDVSIAEYHQFRMDREVGDEKSAQVRLEALREYNAYDCLSTQRLRDWLIDVAGVSVHEPGASDGDDAAEPLDLEPSEIARERARLARALGERAEASMQAADESDAVEASAWRMLAAAVGYHRREDLPFWWGHFHRLNTDRAEWEGERDVFSVERAEVLADWATQPRQRNPRRTLRLSGSWAPGSTGGRGAYAVYEVPGPRGTDEHDVYAVSQRPVTLSTPDPDNRDVIEVIESTSAGAEYPNLPIAFTPTTVMATSVEKSIHRYADAVLDGARSPSDPAWDLLVRGTPRLVQGATLAGIGVDGDAAEVLARAVLDLDHSYLAVQGPPGSGKSWTAARVIRTLVRDHGWRIGVVAQSHAVVENLLDGIVGDPDSPQLDPTLVGKSDPHQDDPRWSVVAASGPQRAAWLDEHRAQGRGCVLGGTAWTFSSEALADAFDLLVVDEAGQFSLANTIAVSPAARNLLLLGDPQQLPQVSQGTHPHPVDTSALGWLMDGAPTLDPTLGFFLPTSWRMAEPVCAPVSALSYDGRLRSSAPSRSLAGVEPGIRVVPVDHVGNSIHSAEEASAVADLVASFLGREWQDEDGTRPLEQTDVLVVAPYNAQVAFVRQELVARGLDQVRVGTVDKFQGQQAPVSILTMSVSSAREAPRGMDFLLNRNRLNVAVSRAKWVACIVHSPRLTSYMPHSVEGLLELGGFLGVLEAGTGVAAS